MGNCVWCCLRRRLLIYFFSFKKMLKDCNILNVGMVPGSFTLLDFLSPPRPPLNNKQLLDEVEHDIMNYQNRGLCYLPKPKAEADNTDTRF